MNRLTLAALLMTAPAMVAAQTTAEKLARGIKAYEEFDVEAARPIFAEIISPSYISPLSQSQKVTAYKYLGASWAVLAQTDSAERYFTAALDFDPFTDLEVDKFTTAETGPFNNAKTKLFRIGMRPVLPRVVNPRADTSYYRFTIVTTHSAQVRLTLVKQNDGNNPTTEVLFEGRNESQRVIAWDGRLKVRSGAIADSGTYLLTLDATSTLREFAGQAAKETQLVRIEQSFDPLEDTLPVLDSATMLLPARIKNREPWLDLGKGVAVGLAAYLLSNAIIKTDAVLDSSGWKPTSHAVISIGIGVSSGFGSFLYRNSRREISANVLENTRRQNQRTRYNQAIAARNATRLGDMLLIITPLSAR